MNQKKINMDTSHLIVEDTNLTNAWRTTLSRVINSRGKEITPLLITLTEFNETKNVRDILESHLKRYKMGSIQTVSETIFPNSLYEYCDKNRSILYKEYLHNLPRIKKIDPSNNHGTYFERLIAYNGSQKKINQLEIIINSLSNKSVKRRSKLQASIFDPQIDHTNKAFQGFPCLQHVTFYKSEDGGLILNSFYAIQYLFRRAYGNWLGLINLGKFIAHELDLKFERFNCYVGIEILDHLKKEEANKLLIRMTNN